MDKKIFLIGYMGCGKSSIGKELAKKMNMPFIDTDAYIEEKNNMTISELMKAVGEEEFRGIEKNVLGMISKEFNRAVIACGGGMPCFYGNIDTMKMNGLTIYLKRSVAKLYERLSKDRAHRPLISALSDEELEKFIKSSLEKREPYYLQAHFTVKTPDSEVDQLMQFIAQTEALYL